MSDREVLLVLYRTTGGPEWRHNVNWNTNADISTWSGVEVRDGRVVGLKLYWNNLKGTIPKELAQLTSLEELLLRGNKLNGPIPKELAQLTSLKALDLSDNKLNGPIPKELAQLTFLEELYLSNNELNGLIPQELAGLKKTKLKLWGNELTGVLKMSPDREALLALYRATGGPQWDGNEGWDTEDDISVWYGVEVQDGRVVGLYLGFNNLKGSIPKELGQLTSLTFLNLWNNYLDGSIPEELGQLTSLTHLYLSNNKLDGFIPKELGLLSNLEMLLLQENQLTGFIPKELGLLSNLEMLWLQENQLTGSIPKELGQLSNLETLWLQGNQLTGSIPKELGQLSNLEILRLQENQLTGSIPEELGQLTSLTHLDLSNNKLDGTIPWELLDMAEINEIDCRGNNLHGNLPMYMDKAEVLRRRQMVQGNTEGHSLLWRAVENLTSLWHFLLPVLDDATDLWLLLETSGGSHRGLWWTCFIVFVIADIERVYTAFFFLVSIVLAIFVFILIVILAVIFQCLGGSWIINVRVSVVNILSFFAMQEVYLHDWRTLSRIVLDSLLWTLFGSRARSSPFMKLFGQAGEETGDDLRDSGLGLHGIDVILFFHPMRYFGEFLLACPRGIRRPRISDRHQAKRREIAMVRAVGETLCVDPLFLALSVVTGDWDDNLTGFAMVSALFSILELVTELQYYVNEAEVVTSVVPVVAGDHGSGDSMAGMAVGNDVESGDHGSGDSMAGMAVGNDVESGDHGSGDSMAGMVVGNDVESGDHGSGDSMAGMAVGHDVEGGDYNSGVRPIESERPVRMP